MEKTSGREFTLGITPFSRRAGLTVAIRVVLLLELLLLLFVFNGCCFDAAATISMMFEVHRLDPKLSNERTHGRRKRQRYQMIDRRTANRFGRIGITRHWGRSRFCRRENGRSSSPSLVFCFTYWTGTASSLSPVGTFIAVMMLMNSLLIRTFGN